MPHYKTQGAQEDRKLPEYMLIMKSTETEGDWEGHIEKLRGTGKFRGGSAFGHGISFCRSSDDDKCIATGYMLFEADSIEEIQELLIGNPAYEAGGSVELHELVVT